ncbi:scavenger receptor class B member 1-like isoform X2 [Acanthaster planci]|uniref:Scavenger receptor class B member 1 n=1 Tax=Acanthaster planci TaxID=133434 RepID=A0A8B7XYH5_ACAPL|nr:scavenger receptor class B member 1-like isoform X2 [Acanthaster planci]XP_022085952.1 scavenger receptor class B member 1-like isoform X2 [Acanthaster planci]XP_022085953.1 scavenger receptor class B member 1-like isoform X2 [Acanthaster planci]
MTVTSFARRLRTRTFVIVLTIGVLMVIIGAVAIPLGFNALMDTILDQMMVISPKSPIYPEWKDPTLPIYTKFYFLDLQNPQEVLEGGRPSVVEIGPYSYKMSLPRENVTFNDNGTVTSTQPYSYVFDRSQSVGDENDTFTTANMPFWSTVYFVRDAGLLIKAALSLFLASQKEEPFMRLSVRQLIWGYDEPLFKWLHENLPDYPLPPGFETQFGFLLGRNDTPLGLYTVFTGVGNKMKVNQIDKFNGMSHLTYWKSESANRITGSDGMMYHRGIEEDEVLNLFHPDLCRSMPYTYVKDDSLKGVPLKIFGVAPWAYQNSTTYPPNQGFNITPDEVPRGLMRIDPCRYGTPIALSNPHFFDGDPSLAGGIDGLSQNPEKHRNYFSIEPILGMPFKLRMRLQINQYMQQVQGISQTGKVKTMYMPGFWFEEDVTANDEVIGYYDTGIKLTGIIALLMQYLSIAIGASIIVAFLLVGFCKLITKEKKSIISEPIETNYDSTHVYDNINPVLTTQRNVQTP